MCSERFSVYSIREEYVDNVSVHGSTYGNNRTAKHEYERRLPSSRIPTHVLVNKLFAFVCYLKTLSRYKSKNITCFRQQFLKFYVGYHEKYWYTVLKTLFFSIFEIKSHKNLPFIWVRRMSVWCYFTGGGDIRVKSLAGRIGTFPDHPYMNFVSLF